MYCYHCGYEIDEEKLEKEKSSLEEFKGDVNSTTTISYVCPRCGHLIHLDATEQDIKSLSAASHAEIQRGRNSLASGMGNICIGSIALILAIVFFRLSFKPGQQNKLVTTCPEFYVCLILFVAAAVLLSVGITFAVLGVKKKKKYETLLTYIRNKTFIQ